MEIFIRLDKQEYISDDEVLEFRQNEIAFYWLDCVLAKMQMCYQKRWLFVCLNPS